LRKDLWPILGKGAAGFILGVCLWWTMAIPYARLVSALTEPLLRAAEHVPVTRLIANGGEITIDRSDFPASSPRPALALAQVTSNIILLTTLFSVNRKALSDRNVAGLLLACVSLVAVHVAAVAVNVQSIYALRLGPWSRANYGTFARNFWGAGAHCYSVVGSFGAAFVLWWLFRPSPLDAAVRRPQRRAR
jgi:hypothetical protein